jgi:MFS family permease
LDDAGYGLLAGPVFSVVFATLVLFTGTLADKYSRRFLLGLAGICWSLTSILTCFSQSIYSFAFYRFLLGVFEAFFAPAAYSLIPDYFPPSSRAKANAFLTLGVVIGSGLASISTLIINSVGWRRTYFLAGAIGVFFAVLALVFVKDPERGRFDPKMAKLPLEPVSESQQKAQPSAVAALCAGFKALVSNKCTRWCMLGGMFRFWQAYTMIYFSISYFAFYGNPIQYGLWNAFSVAVGGFSSSMIAGIISDKFENRSYKTKAYVAVVMSVNAIFTSMVLFLVSNSFGFSMTMVFLNSLLCEGWASPVMTMIQTVIPVEKKAAAIGAF